MRLDTWHISCCHSASTGVLHECARLCAVSLLAACFASFAMADNTRHYIHITPDGIGMKDEVLFSVRADIMGCVPYNALFVQDAPCAPLQPLTAYPERMELLSDGRFQVRSRYGAAIYDTNTSELYIDKIKDIPDESMRLAAVLPSPNGKWTLFVRRSCSSEGVLVLKSTASGKEYVLDDNAAFAYENIPAKWSPDGGVFVYGKDGCVYFCDPDALSQGLQIDEHYRCIGTGTIACVEWTSASAPSNASSSDLYYIEGNSINAFSQKGLYTQVIYADILGHGRYCGRLPSQFDGERDTFSVRADGKAIAVLKDNALLSVYSIAQGNVQSLSAVQVSDVSSPLLNARILWGAQGDALVWTLKRPWAGKETAVVYRVGDKSTVLMKEQGHFSPPVPSPNGNRIAFYNDTSLRVYDTGTWRLLGKYTDERIASAIWDGNYAMYLGGESTVSRWIVGDNATEPLFPSSVQSGCYQGNSIIALCPNKKAFSVNLSRAAVTSSSSGSGTIHWEKFAGVSSLPQVKTLQSAKYRVFTAPSPNPRFDNALYVRELRAKGVTRLVSAVSGTRCPARRRIALLLDAYNNADNLAFALHALDISGVKGTVFLNGAFISRCPAETQSIANSTATCASLFFADTDLVGGSFVADETFIMRGLSRNEDDYLRVTGKELTPLWHAPRYRADDAVRNAGAASGYRYVDAVHSCNTDNTIAQLLDALSESEVNALAVTVGSPISSRLDVLIGALLDAGYEIVGAEEL